MNKNEVVNPNLNIKLILFSMNAVSNFAFKLIKGFYYIAKASGEYDARSDWLRTRSQQGITQP